MLASTFTKTVKINQKNNPMKISAILVISFISILAFSSCEKDKNRVKGICYCEFFNGDKQEYDLRHLNQTAQMDTCNMHDNNAGNFGGECELE